MLTRLHGVSRFGTTSQIFVQRSSDGGVTYSGALGEAVDAATEPSVGPPTGNIAGQIKVEYSRVVQATAICTRSLWAPTIPRTIPITAARFECCLRGRGYGRESHESRANLHRPQDFQLWCGLHMSFDGRSRQPVPRARGGQLRRTCMPPGRITLTSITRSRPITGRAGLRPSK